MNTTAGGDDHVSAYVDQLFEEAIRQNATNLYLEYRPGDPLHFQVRVRIHGMLQLLRILSEPHPSSEESITALYAELKSRFSMDPKERKPQTGRLRYETTYMHRGSREFMLTAATIPTNGDGESFVITVQPALTADSLTELGMYEEDQQRLHQALNRPGLVLFTGLNETGKNTTMRMALKEHVDDTKKALLLEELITERIYGVDHIEIGGALMSIPQALKAMLRTDPDVLAIEGFRDKESLDYALRAAVVGRLILGSMTTGSPVATLVRLLRMGLEPWRVAEGVSAVVHQRLIRRLCPHCCVEDPAAQDVLQKFVGVALSSIPMPTQVRAANPAGCADCLDGYSGRIGVFEVLVLDEPVRQALLDQDYERLGELAQTRVGAGLVGQAASHALHGLTSPEEVQRLSELL